ncbi:MAG: GbsR/MarR family transcriptional regulator [Halothermotrichaceae bacterium]
MIVDNQIKNIRKIIIEAAGRSFGVYGMNETIGRIYGYLYFEEEPVSLNHIAEELGVSKATISINIRLLLDFKMVQKVWQKGSRKDFYTAETDFIKIVQEILKNKEKTQVLALKDAAVKARQEYQTLSNKNPEKKDIIKSDLEKINEIEKWVKEGEKWLNFFIDYTSTEENIEEDIREIKVEWDDKS